ncbi:lytic transglycosylase domain-containing protein [Bacillus kwashiorkori]|uniref:lytic transglycosylase domain-containing protein n=1 Tax=Bacillus kwashiorkori TaxID=1522318 RepID=UPI000783F1DC|nr:lytic transglycosylase domain-containing protein [Bacillus kwashiorkori]
MNIQQLKLWMEISTLRNLNSSNQVNSSPSGESFSSLLEHLLLSGNNYSVSQPAKMNAQQIDRTAYPINHKYLDNKSSGFAQLSNIVEEAASRYNLPVALINTVIKHESNFNQHAVSSAGASGYMQLMPSTAKSLGVKNIFDARENIMAGAKYLRSMLDRYGKIELALAAYNAGPGNVEKYNGIPPFRETQNYVTKILNDLTVS